jgi:3-deoxy-D-manno-octulosonic acid (KDO) 8-phosphate synthase
MKNEIFKFKIKRKKIKKKIEIKKKNFINLFDIENKVRKIGKRQTKRIARKF